MSLITLFTAPKPFRDAHITTIQRNALESWKALGPAVEILLVGEEDGLAETAAEMGLRHLPQVARNALGTPLVSSIFELAREHSDSPILGYVNADILLLPELIPAVEQVRALRERFLMVGQRWDLDVRERLEFSPGWDTRLSADIQARGRLHPPGGSDYFFFPRECFRHMPAFAIGRAGWDNWMIYEARRSGWTVVNATPSMRIVHQDHDYSHLPNGQPHYRLPETNDNVRLAGGRRTIFGLWDCERELVQGALRRPRLSWKRLWREVEIFPLVKLRSMALGQVFYAVFHPLKAYREVRAWLRARKS